MNWRGWFILGALIALAVAMAGQFEIPWAVF